MGDDQQLAVQRAMLLAARRAEAEGEDPQAAMFQAARREDPLLAAMYETDVSQPRPVEQPGD